MNCYDISKYALKLFVKNDLNSDIALKPPFFRNSVIQHKYYNKYYYIFINYYIRSGRC